MMYKIPQNHIDFSSFNRFRRYKTWWNDKWLDADEAWWKNEVLKMGCFGKNRVFFVPSFSFQQKTRWPLVGNEGINLYIGILGMKLPSFPTSRAS